MSTLGRKYSYCATLETNGDARYGTRVEREQRRFHRLVHRDRAARALRDLKRLRVTRRLELPIEAREILCHHRPDVRIERGRGHALVFAPFRRDVDGAGHE